MNGNNTIRLGGTTINNYTGQVACYIIIKDIIYKETGYP